MIPAELRGVLVSTPDTLGGDLRFVGTRVPLRALLDAVAVGHGLPEFLNGCPTVQPELAQEALVWVSQKDRRTYSFRDSS